MSRKMKDSGAEWIGDIPEDWGISKIKYHADIVMGQSPSSEDYNSEKKGVPFLQGNADFTDKYPLERIYTINANKYSKEGDILLSVRAPVGAKNISNKVYAIGRGLCAISATKLFNKFLWYLIDIMNKEFKLDSRGSTYDSITISDVKNALITLPSINEQQQIGDFLDQKVAEIDHIIDKTKLSIEEYKKYKQSLITETVTKGLNKNVKMKDSGIEWIGEIPEHWEATKLKFLSSINTGGKDTIDRNELGEYPFFVRSPIIERIDSYSYDGEAILMAGDGVGAGRVFHHVKEKFDYHQRVYCIHNLNNVYGRFLYYYLKEFFYNELSRSNAKSTVDSVRLPMLLNFYITVSSIEEQQGIANFLDKKCNEIDTLILQKEQLLIELKSYKKSLIFECVTGKREVV